MAGKVSSDPNVFLLPDIGEGLQEAEVIRWLVKEGETVEENQPLAEVQTDKALTEIPSPRNGVIARIHGVDGQVMKVHEPFVTYVGEGGQTPAAPPKKTVSAKATRVEVSVADAEQVPERTEDDGTVVGKMSGELAGMSASPGKALATPAVRRLARDLGIDIDHVRGTGIGGRVTEKDVRAATAGGPGSSAQSPARASAAAAAPAARPLAATSPGRPAAPAQRVQIPSGQDSTRIPIRDVRKIIASRLRQSVDRAVHFTVMDEADVSALDALRKKLAAASGEKVSFLPFVCSAVCRALSGGFGALNATVDDDRNEIVQHRAVHLGIATDTDNGLMVPVIPDADRLGVLEISRHVAAVAEAARNRTASRDQLSGSTFTISNVGSHAGRFATPVINYPEVGILAVGRTREGMVVKDGWFRVGKLMPLSLACDHRVVDGATAALALAEIVRLLQEPDQLLAPAR
ncbi:MAG: 2-oxo acid dehydrogenase subunit E2 [Phycisphaeraceae bacterium]|nr:2-oxo acid dehydrogenase subunit E2 [Phycisphaeraceae bacterium]